MIFNNQLAPINLLGSFYLSGNIIFQGNTLYSAIHNVVKRIDLVKNQTEILPFQNTHQIRHILITSNHVIMITIDYTGRAIVFNLKGRFIVVQYNFKGPVQTATLSPDGKLLAIGQQHGFTIYELTTTWRTFEPFILIKKYKNRHSGLIHTMQFSSDSRFLATAGLDNIVYITNLFPIPDFMAITLQVHRFKIISIHYSYDMKYLYTFDEGSNIFLWKWVDDNLTEKYENLKASKKRVLAHNRGMTLEQFQQAQQQMQTQGMSQFEKNASKGRYILSKKLIVTQPGNLLRRVFYEPKTGFLSTAYSKGKFAIYKLLEQELTEVQTYSIGDNKITTIAVNPSCTWIALGIKNQGQLLVWQWRSQSYIINQSGFTFETKCLAYNKNNLIATGNTSGKVRIWDQKSGFCLSTFEQHESSVTGLKFSNNFTLFSCSLDGSVNGYDTIKYKKFRKFRADVSCQFTSITTDEAGQIVFAGAVEPFQVYAWNIQTSHLLQIIKGHTGPISSLQFCQQFLLTGSWDKNLRIHDVFSRKLNQQSLDHNSQIMAIAVHPNKTQIAVSTMKGQIFLWDPKDCSLRGIINTQMQGGRSYDSKISAQNDKSTKYLCCLAYTPCGNYLVGGGKSKYLMVYDIKHRMVLKKISITNNKDLQGVVEKLNSRYVKNGVSTYFNELQRQMDDQQKMQAQNAMNIPGSKSHQIEKLRGKLEVEIKSLTFLDQITLAVQTSFGLLIFSSKSSNKHFNPYQLSTQLKPSMIPEMIKKRNYTDALSIAVSLNLSVTKLLKKIPIENVRKIAEQLSQQYSLIVLEKISEEPINLRGLIWIQALLHRDIQNIPQAIRRNLEAFQRQMNIMKKSYATLEMSQYFITAETQ